MKSELSRAKDRAWEAFSKYIRLRDCLKTTGTPDWGICITCNKRTPFKEYQAGHMVEGRKNAVLYDEEIVNGQCQDCNGYGGGEYARYALVMEERHSRQWVLDKLNLKHVTKPMKAWEHREIAQIYKKKYNELKCDILDPEC